MPKKSPTEERRKLRAEAEARFARTPPAVPPLHPPAALLHELQVHQIELEMQNEELRRSEIGLQEARDQYRKLYDSAYHFAPVGYFTVSDSGLVLDLNLTAAGFLGQERKDILGSPFPRHFPVADADRWHNFQRHLRSLGDTGSIDVMILPRQGKPLPVRLDCSVEDGDGGRLVMRVVLTDLSSTASIKNELRESQERIEEFLAESRDGYWEWSHERKLLLSARLTEILAIGGGVLGEPRSDRAAWLRRVHEADAAAVTNAIMGLITGSEDRCDIVVRWALPAGTWKPLRLRGHVLKRTDSGEPTRIAGTVTDLSDQPGPGDARSPRRAWEALAATVIRNFPGGVVALFDGGLRYTLIEGSAELGRTTRRSLASCVLMGDWGHEQGREIESVLRGALAGKSSATEVSVDGTRVDVRAGPVTNPDGSITMGVATFHVRSAGPGTPPGGEGDVVEGPPDRRGRTRGSR